MDSVQTTNGAERQTNQTFLSKDLTLITLVLIIKCALTAPSLLRLGSLQWVLMGTPGEIEGRYRKVILGTHQVWRITLEQGAFRSQRELCFHFILPQGPSFPGSPPQPLRLGWLLEAKATALPEQLLQQPIWLDSADPDRCRLQVVVALCIKPAP